MKNNKGFTLVEILAAVAILGILSGIAIAAYSRYIAKSRNEALKVLADSSAEAAEEYFMDHLGETEVTFAKLVDDQYLESARDPLDNSKNCKGKVEVNTTTSSGKLDVSSYKVTMCCIDNNYTYTYPDPNGKKIKFPDPKNQNPKKVDSCPLS